MKSNKAGSGKVAESRKKPAGLADHLRFSDPGVFATWWARALMGLHLFMILFVLLSIPRCGVAQTVTPADGTTTAISQYVDQKKGLTVDEAVAYALAHNGELEAARKEIDVVKA